MSGLITKCVKCGKSLFHIEIIEGKGKCSACLLEEAKKKKGGR